MKTGEKIEETIKLVVTETLSKSKEVEMPDDLIETDNIGEVIEKLSILHFIICLILLKSKFTISRIKYTFWHLGINQWRIDFYRNVVNNK